MLFDDRTDDRKAEAGALGGFARLVRNTIKAFEDPFQVASRNTNALVAYKDVSFIEPGRSQLYRYLRTGRRVFDRVVEQITKRRLKFAPVPNDAEALARTRESDSGVIEMLLSPNG